MTNPKLLTISEAVDALDVPTVERPARWLRRHLQRAEERTGRTLLVRIGSGRRRPTYRVDLEAVRLACPELFSVRDPIARVLQGCAVAGREELAALRERMDELGARQAAIAGAIRRIEGKLTGRGVRGREGGGR